MLAILPLLFAILAPTWPAIRSKMPSSSQHHRRQPPRCLSHPFRAPKSATNQREPKVFQCFSLSSHGAKINQKCSQNHPRSSQVDSTMAILLLSWSILRVSCPILVATCRQFCASFANRRRNFARICQHMPPCTRRSAPRAPKILPALKLPRFLTLPELHQCRFWVPRDTHSPHYAIKASSDSTHSPNHVFPWA